MKTKMNALIPATLILACSLATGMAHAQQAPTILVEFQGPGGHSSSNYGRTSALHAAARSVIALQKMGMAGGTYTVSSLTGGNSVNSIAFDGSYEVRLTAQAGISQDEFLQKVNAAAKAGADAENAFRKVKPGDLTAGAPADIRYTVTQK